MNRTPRHDDAARDFTAKNIEERLDFIAHLGALNPEQRARYSANVVDAVLFYYHQARRAEVDARAEDRRQFQHALDTAADPHAAWPPKVIARISPDTSYGEIR